MKANDRLVTSTDVAVVGAGPYGLSIAANLRARGVAFRIFGRPMQTWMTQMPKGMHLKSEGFASSIDDPDSSFTLAHYCKEKNLPYAHTGNPVPLETFIAYGLEFQRRFVPDLEDNAVASVQRLPEGFHVGLADGKSLLARRVVVAAGISHFAYLPPELSSLPEEFVTHSSRHATLDHFAGRDVIVLGAGASAVDVAALLHQTGARVQLVARRAKVRFHDPPTGASSNLLEQIRNPMTGIGPGWKLFFYANAPHWFRHLPLATRLRIVKVTLGPAPGWFVKEQVVGKFPFHLGATIKRASVQNGRLNVLLTDSSGGSRTIEADHLIAGTGYRVDLRRLGFLDSETLSKIDSVENTPKLSSMFESSVPGLYFVGACSANTFGPLMRFAFGAKFTARRLAGHLAKNASRRETTREIEQESVQVGN